MRFVLGRLGHSALVLLSVSVLTFALIELSPGEFFDDLKIDARIGASTVETLRQQSGLTESPITRYLTWVRSVGRGELGISLAHRVPVGTLLWERARNTLLLTVPATLVCWAIALPLGLWLARHRGRWVNRLFNAASSTLLSLPDILIALVLLFVALRTGLFPTGGMFSPGVESLGGAARIRDLALHALLPFSALLIVLLPPVVRHVRASAIEAIDAPAVRAARGHGISGWHLTTRYILPLSANPLISLAGLSCAALVSASVLIEVVMSWPGLGPLLVESLLAKDVHVVLGASMLATVFLVTGNLLADVMLYAVDPRVRS
ncbi:MAG TPA: ABC transporter permease [Vicinamibacterales bacterium]